MCTNNFKLKRLAQIGIVKRENVKLNEREKKKTYVRKEVQG